MLLVIAILLLFFAAASAVVLARSPVYRMWAYTIDQWAEDVHGIEAGGCAGRRL